MWSGGSFVYVPPGVEVKMPLQAYFRINTENMGQFERTLIIADKGSKVHYIEGCTAPKFSTSSLHSAVVELIAMEGASIRYTTIQNWYRNIYNLVTKRAVAYKNATVEWVDGNIGSRLTMKYPAIYLMGEGARGEILSAAFAGEGQHQDAGAKVIHGAPNTTSVVTNKSVSAHGGKTTYRGLVEIHKGAVGAKTRVKCDALIMDDRSSSRHEADDEDRRAALDRRTRSVGLEDRRGTAVLRDEPRLERSRRDRDDRQRLLRLLRQGVADGIRGRTQPLDQDGNGRIGRLVRPLRVALITCALVAAPDRATRRPASRRAAASRATGNARPSRQHRRAPRATGAPGDNRPGPANRAARKPDTPCDPINGNYNGYYPYVYVNGDNYMTPSPHHTPTPHPKNQNNTQNGQQVFSSYSTGN